MIVTTFSDSNDACIPTFAQGEFRPKQSLGQNYLTDQNYVLKICNHFGDTSDGGKTVVELGPGTGALTQVRYSAGLMSVSEMRVK